MPDLIDLATIEEARRIKYEIGIKQHRGGQDDGEFVGDWLVEVYEEHLDGMNFSSHGRTVEPPALRPKIDQLFALSLQAARLCRELKAERDAHGL